jgi:hypothetical protein
MNDSEATTPQRKGFVSPLERARAGKIGGGKEKGQPPQERQDVQTFERRDVPVEIEEADTAKKSKREDTHFRQTVWMPKPLNRRLKVHAAKAGDDVSGIINKLVADFLDREED